MSRSSFQSSYVVGVGGPLAIALLVQLTWPGDPHPASDFYATVAAVVPVLLLALTVEMAGAFSMEPLRREFERADATFAKLEAHIAEGEADPEERERAREMVAKGRRMAEERRESVQALAVRIRHMVRVLFIQAALAEAASLYAIGAQRSSAFLASLCIAALALLGGGLWSIYELRFEARHGGSSVRPCVRAP